jgi:hypothetical protein
MIVDNFYIQVLDEDDQIIHQENAGSNFPSVYVIEKLLKQVAASHNENVENYTVKIDKRYKVLDV